MCATVISGGQMYGGGAKCPIFAAGGAWLDWSVGSETAGWERRAEAPSQFVCCARYISSSCYVSLSTAALTTRRRRRLTVHVIGRSLTLCTDLPRLALYTHCQHQLPPNVPHLH